MSQYVRPNVETVLRTLKDSQHECVEYAFRRMYLDEKSTDRFLVADEAHVRRTLVACGLIAKAVDHLRDTDDRIDMVHVCADADVTRQNIRRLGLFGQPAEVPDRPTLLPRAVHDLDGNRVNLIPLTGTSFDLKGRLGNWQDRALLYRFLDHVWGFGQGTGPDNLLQGTAPIHTDRFSEEVRLARKRNLTTVSGQTRRKLGSLVDELRRVLPESWIEALEPVLVSLDEFQRFKDLLYAEDDAVMLAKRLFEYQAEHARARLLRLSATPHRMDTLSREGLEGRTTEIEPLLEKYRAASPVLPNGNIRELHQTQARLEEALGAVMIRTERLAASTTGNGMLTSVATPMKLTPYVLRQAPPTSSRLSEHWASWGAARDGARVVLTRTQTYALALLIVLGPILLVARPRPTLIAFIGLVTALYLAIGAYKVWLLIRGERGVASAAADSQPAAEDDLPVYTVLVPLHHEGRILPVLVERLKLIDYPPERLEILLLIELDDEETQSAARNCPLPFHIRPMILPPGQPRTKPRALNIGLHEAQGEYIVVYDAEDRPERDQLRKAVAAFRALPAHVVCVQGRLNFYNRYQSLLTRMFAVEYAVLFDQLLPGLTHSGLTRSGAFVPLGGTSNHFRVDILRQIGGWDPFNVTEDCDLGVRLGRKGLRVAMLDSMTSEEAVTHVKPWIRQRSRWIKGYLQTYLVHMRHPLLLWKQLGPRGFIDFQMLVGASSVVLLLNPLMWLLTATYVASKGTYVGNGIETLFPAALYYPALLSLLAGNFILFYGNAYVCVRHNLIDLTRYTLLTPLYWLLMSFGAWAGLISLIRNPFYWAKTDHGVSLSEPEGRAVVAVGHMQPEQ
jgi:cellulose synthase/poly-beta-1,6-N-acetylglucosamine synthase-like glycosyltransferase